MGKTQLALEYVHRFRADYDIIWWMNCGQPQYIDASLLDLGGQLHAEFIADVSEEGSVGEISHQVLRLLSDGLAGRRWLLVYDNADRLLCVIDPLPS